MAMVEVHAATSSPSWTSPPSEVDVYVVIEGTSWWLSPDGTVPRPLSSWPVASWRWDPATDTWAEYS